MNLFRKLVRLLRRSPREPLPQDVAETIYRRETLRTTVLTGPPSTRGQDDWKP